MLIPNFKCRQDDKFVYVEIKARNAKLERTEFDVNKNVMIFTSPPYYLRLNLPGDIEYVEQDEDNCKWISDTNEFILKLKKSNENEHFDGLDLISKLLTLPTEDELNRKTNLIEVIDGDNPDELSGDDLDDNLNDDFDLREFAKSSTSVIDTKHNYGFLNRHSNVIEKYQDDLWQLTDLKNPGELSIEQRREQRLTKEAIDFNEEAYLYDQYENSLIIDSLRASEAKWLDLADEYTDDEVFRLKNLKRKEFKFTKEEKQILIYGLVDVLFGYCYDKRVNEGELSSESAWNISKLSATFSWFDSFWLVDDVIVSCLRRSLIYPLYRSFELSKTVLKDLVKILRSGQVQVIKCLLEIQKLFNDYGEFKYLINDLYVNDFIIAIQYLDKKYLNRLADLLDDKIDTLDKDQLDLDLVLLDKAMDAVLLEQFEKLEC